MTEWIKQFMSQMGYVGLAILTFLENIFPPLPSEVILPLGGFFVAEGRLTLAGVVLAGTVGSLAGAVALYYVGRLFSQSRLERWADRHGHWLLLSRSDVSGAFNWFEDHGGKAVFLCRLIPGVRSLISIPAGSTKMAIAPFLLYTALGTALWSALLAFGGMQLGEAYQDLSRVLRWASYAVIGLFILSFVWWALQKRQEQKEDEKSAASPSKT